MTEIGEDALSGLAPLLRVRPQLDDVCRFGGTWAAAHEPEPAGQAYFHIITHGRAILQRPGDASLPVEAGDILLLPRGTAHTMRDPDLSVQVSLPVLVRNQGSLRFKTSLGVEPEVELLCGRLRFEAAPQNLIVAALPDLLVLRVGEQPLSVRFHPLLVGIREELAEERAGALAIAENLASVLFMLMLRTHLEGSAPTDGLLRLLGQRITAQAVLAMVRDPVRAWTLDDLAAVAAASRATLVRAFRKAAGVPPLEFLSELRLGLARHRLRTASASLDEIAAEAGYQSPGAFSRAFLRKYGVRPGRVRQEALSPGPD
ncbi:AraC family transcriptional regulator [Methylobacterium frigidaeris]|uniref:IS5 family transposase IS4811 n=1 Tax=Methylobacterium frigidaeris TaxID=2038277 RepID=A0AA37HJI7_9HYPH|nr:AraC family transcriptional regulator [Methylobacterium frigidaeris]GJD66962.1 IS5 family transposase IS4811 [Methylobacterium frigidaeris]